MFEAISAQSIRRITEFNAQNLSNTSWAYATRGVPDSTLLDAIAAEAIPKISQFTPQNLSNMAWSYDALMERDLLGGLVEGAS